MTCPCVLASPLGGLLALAAAAPPPTPSLPQEKVWLDRITPEGGTYSGPAEQGVASFSLIGPDNVPGIGSLQSWVAKHLVDNIITEIKVRYGGLAKVLRVRVWRDTGPLLRTNYTVELTVVPPVVTVGTGQQGSFAAAFLAGLPGLLLVVLALILAYVLLRPVLRSVRDVVWGPSKPGVIIDPVTKDCVRDANGQCKVYEQPSGGLLAGWGGLLLLGVVALVAVGMGRKRV